MADAAAFFAKKTKKKPFSFNANRVDASQITSTAVHVDAPAISDSISMGSLSLTHNADRSDGQWDEAPGTVLSSKQIAPKSASNVSEISDMKSMVNKAEDESTKKGIEQYTQASRSKIEKNEGNTVWNMKSNASMTATAPIETPESDPVLIPSSTTGKWIPSRLRSDESDVPTQGSSTQIKKKDTMDDLFPDLVTADKIMAQVEEQKLKNRAYAPPLKATTKTSKTEYSSDHIVKETITDSFDDAHSTSFLQPSEKLLIDSTYSIPSSEHVSEITIVNDVTAESVDEKYAVDDINSSVQVVDSGPSQGAMNDSDSKSAIKKKKKKDLSTFKVS